MAITKEELRKLQHIRQKYNTCANKVEWWALSVVIDAFNNCPKSSAEALKKIKEALENYAYPEV